MLVLTRKTDEAIVIDGRITIKLLQMKGNRIRLGIDAPQDVSIRRSEIAAMVGDNGRYDVSIERVANGDQPLAEHVA